MIATKPLKYISSIVIDAFLGDMSDKGIDNGNYLNLCSNTHLHLWIFTDKIDS